MPSPRVKRSAAASRSAETAACAPSLERELGARRVRVEAEHAAAVGAQQLHRELPDQAEAEHRDALAERRRRLAHALQRDRADRGEARRLHRDAVGNPRDQVARHVVVVGVVRVAGAGAGDAIADAVLGDLLAHLDHHAGARVAERDRRIELALHLLEGVAHALLARRVDHLAHQVRPRARLREQALAREVDDHLLGAGRDERAHRPHHARRPGARAGGGTSSTFISPVR